MSESNDDMTKMFLPSAARPSIRGSIEATAKKIDDMTTTAGSAMYEQNAAVAPPLSQLRFAGFSSTGRGIEAMVKELAGTYQKWLDKDMAAWLDKKGIPVDMDDLRVRPYAEREVVEKRMDVSHALNMQQELVEVRSL